MTNPLKDFGKQAKAHISSGVNAFGTGFIAAIEVMFHTMKQDSTKRPQI